MRRVLIPALMLLAALPFAAKAEELAGLTPWQAVTQPDPGPATEAALPMPRVKDLSIGRQGARTRVVLDVEGEPRFDYLSTSSGRSVLLSFPGIAWTPEKSRRGGGLVRKYLYNQRPDGSGHLALLTSQPVEVTKAFVLSPKGGADTWRIVVDLLPKSALN